MSPAKSPAMYATMLGLWGLTVALSLPFFVNVVTASESLAVAALRTVIVTSLAVFWLYGVFNIVITVWGYLYEATPERLPYGAFREQEVAIVYPTYNDFAADALAMSMQQGHEHVHTYIVDDSTDAEVVAEIDEFATTHEAVTVVRREGRGGYKAGALNNALANVVTEPYFVIMDADEVLPGDFLERAFTYFTAEDIAFVQGNHDYNKETATRFGQALGIGVDIHWDVYQPPRNRFGFVMLLGHGALVRRDAWEDVGGFPEIVSEDLAFSTRLREFGYKGAFAKDIDCLEDFPVDYESFRIRHKKWTAGSIEYIQKDLPRYLKARSPSLVEKLDVAIPTFQLPLTVLFVAYIAVVGALSFLTDAVIPQAAEIPWFLGAVTVLTLMAPLYCYIVGLWRRPRKLAHFVATSTTVYCSVAVTAVTHGFSQFLPDRSAEFLTTPKKESSTVNLRAYTSTLVAGVGTLALATQAGLLVGAAAFTWVVSPSIEFYNHETTAGAAARTLALVPICLMFGGIGYGLWIMLA